MVALAAGCMILYEMRSMKGIFKSAAKAILGEARSKRLYRTLMRQKRPFSEADLIYEHFLGRRTPGVMVDVSAHFGESLRPYLGRGWNLAVIIGIYRPMAQVGR